MNVTVWVQLGLRNFIRVSIVNELSFNCIRFNFKLQFSHVNKWHNSPFTNNYFVSLKQIFKTRITFTLTICFVINRYRVSNHLYNTMKCMLILANKVNETDHVLWRTAKLCGCYFSVRWRRCSCIAASHFTTRLTTHKGEWTSAHFWRRVENR